MGHVRKRIKKMVDRKKKAKRGGERKRGEEI
jgi:hypothetical protein